MATSSTLNRAADALPPHVWFGVSAVFHYLGPAFAVLLFPSVGVLGVAWMRITWAALIFAPITRPWATVRNADARTRRLLLALGICLAVMNSSFYLALDRLPMSLVAAIEFVGTIGIALYGLRTKRNVLALLLAVLGVLILIDVKWSNDATGLAWAFLNGALFIAYIILGHKISEGGASGGVEQLGAAMAIAFVAVMPIGFLQAVHALSNPWLLAAGLGVGLCSSVIPYVCDQIAMSRLPRATFAVMLTLLPASAAIIGAVVLAQMPAMRDVAGIALVMIGVAIHRPTSDAAQQPKSAIEPSDGTVMHIHKGSCHCGAIELEVRSERAPQQQLLGACQCSFCRKHNARAFSDPKASVTLSARDPDQLQQYAFGLKTAEQVICRRCGVYMGMVLIDGSRAWSTINIDTLDDRLSFTGPLEARDFDAEDTTARVARRKARWTPTVLIGWPMSAAG